MVSFTITEKGYVEEDFLAYIGDENIVSFPWTIIDKITPRPSEAAGPMISELQAQMAGIEFGNPQSLTDQLRGILSNKNIFGIDLYASGIGEQIEEMVREQLAGPGAVRKTLQKYLHTAAPK